MKTTPKFGLKPLPVDSRDIKLGAVFTLPSLKELPESFDLGETPIYNQEDTDFCTACSTCGASFLQEGVELSPEYSFALIKELDGDIEGYGADLRIAMKAHVRYGAIAREDSPFRFGEKTGDFMRRISNWSSELKEKAEEHQKQSYLIVQGQYDPFDDIRATIWKFKDKKYAPVIGVLFGWELQQQYMYEPTDSGGGHAMFVKGWKMFEGKMMVAVVNSYGRGAGINGVHYFSREVINKWVNMYGAYVMIDKPLKEIKNMIENNIKDTDNIFIVFAKKFLQFLIKKFPNYLKESIKNISINIKDNVKIDINLEK